ncbi:hypothetical protein HGA88_05290 [Candidatus Roizmanbacteria bacterium]|nr:hypothetical protein [Candidatus Roizmanbacteria bacterium]
MDPQQQPPTGLSIKLVPFIFIVVFVAIFSSGATQLYFKFSAANKSSEKSLEPTLIQQPTKQLIEPTTVQLKPTTTIPVNPKPSSGLNTVNMSMLTSDDPNSSAGKAALDFGFRVRFPARYYATTDEMMTSYLSQGGKAPPRILLTIEKQPLDTMVSGTDYIDYTKVIKSGKECIAIWTTQGFSTFEAWRSINADEFQSPVIASTSEKKMGKYSYKIEDVRYSHENISRREALLVLPEGVDYYIHTCSMSNIDDLDIVLNNLDIRGKR